MTNAEKIAGGISNAASELLNSGVKLHQHRIDEHESKQEESKPVDLISQLINEAEENDKHTTLIPSDPFKPTKEKLGRIPTHEDFCNADIQRAHAENKPDPDFDFREDYFQGQKVYYIYRDLYSNQAYLMHLTVRTVYPRMIVLVEDKGMCHCISYNNRDDIYTSYTTALDVINNLKNESGVSIGDEEDLEKTKGDGIEDE